MKCFFSTVQVLSDRENIAVSYYLYNIFLMIKIFAKGSDIQDQRTIRMLQGVDPSHRILHASHVRLVMPTCTLGMVLMYCSIFCV